ncbi:MarR family winged helix-turn-helix transcriptional regulator [Gordoniibacillus kamchatkensis]|uniref:MarR family winged helix-turn-helix transcriptional regulator n=1 Tax=Gordoniibacillus kamchatkensis TaxID=1590651 RepID=UPI000698B6F9|nr:MarR family transcriptional regulator [Paenibacillus sp. VKM B-2647]
MASFGDHRDHVGTVREFIILMTKRMKQCADTNRLRCSEQLDAGKMSAQDFALVLALAEHGTMPVKDIAARLPGISLSTLTRVLDKLEEHGFITRTLDAGDRRSFLISATDKSLEAATNYFRQVDGVAESMLGVLTDSERQTLAELLGKVRHRLKEE